MIVNIVANRLQVITVKNIAAVIVVVQQWLVKIQLDGLMENHLKEIEQEMVVNSKNGEKTFLKEMVLPAKCVVKKQNFMHTILLNGQKMKVKGLILVMELHFALFVMGRSMVKTLRKGIKKSVLIVVRKLKEKVITAVHVQQKTNGQIEKYCQVIIDRMQKLDPDITVKKL